MTDISAAVFDPAVQAAVADATVLEHVDLPASNEDGHNPLLSNARIVRDPEPADYVAAIHERIDSFGLTTADVTEAAVAAVLPQEEES